ncbi:MAG: hypothetical protein ABWW66_03180 [Archaeoglobaceae archaeon]
MELERLAATVLRNFDALKRLLAERAICNEDEIVIFDDPLKVVVKRDRIEFYIDDEFRGFVNEGVSRLDEEVAREAELWLRAMSSLKFKRYTPR